MDVRFRAFVWSVFQLSVLVSFTAGWSARALADETVLFLPLENRTGRQDLYWLGEAIVEVLARNLEGNDIVLPLHPIRRHMAETYGFTYPLPVSLPTAVWIAYTVDASLLITGYYTMEHADETLTVVLQFIDPLRRRPPVQWQDTGPLKGLMEMLRASITPVAEHIETMGIPVWTRPAFWPTMSLEYLELYIKALWSEDPTDRWQRLLHLISAAPGFEAPRWDLIWTAHETGTLEESIAREIDRWVEERQRRSMDPDERLLFATWQYLRQRWDQAIHALLVVSQTDPSPVIANNLGVVLARVGRIEIASYYLNRAVRERPDVRVLAWNRLMLALLQRDWAYVRESLPDLWTETLHPALLVGAAWTAAHFGDRTAADTLLRWAQKARISAPKRLENSWVHTQWHWVPFRRPFWPWWDARLQWMVENTDASEGLWSSLDALYGWLDELLNQNHPQAIQKLKASLQALGWIHRDPVLLYYRAHLLEREGQATEAIAVMRRYYEQTQDERALEWLTRHGETAVQLPEHSKPVR